MSFMFGVGICINCKTPMSFNPDKVPSLVVRGEREPLCRSCVERWNEIHRTSKGLSPVPIPEDAYEPQETA